MNTINLSSVPTREAMAFASMCEPIRIPVVNLTPSKWPVRIPVRFVGRPLDIARLEELVDNRLATKAEFRLLRKLCLTLVS